MPARSFGSSLVFATIYTTAATPPWHSGQLCLDRGDWSLMNVLMPIFHCVSHQSSRSFETVIVSVNLKSAALIRENCVVSYQELHNLWHPIAH